MAQLSDLMKDHMVFSRLEAGAREALARQATCRDLAKGEVLAMQGDLWPYLFLVAEGRLDAVKTSAEGRALLVTTFGAGELFWGLTFFQPEAPLLATFQAQTRTRVHLWPRELIEPIFLANGRMSWELCHLMILRMQRASAIVEELAFQPVAGRLARLLLDNFATSGEPSMERTLTLDEMAARVGTTREMVCRALYRFADKELINVTRTEFILTDREGLARLAEGG